MVSITVPLTSSLTGLDLSVLQIKTKIVTCHTADSNPVKQEVNGTVILPSLVFPALAYSSVAWVTNKKSLITSKSGDAQTAEATEVRVLLRLPVPTVPGTKTIKHFEP